MGALGVVIVQFGDRRGIKAVASRSTDVSHSVGDLPPLLLVCWVFLVCSRCMLSFLFISLGAFFLAAVLGSLACASGLRCLSLVHDFWLHSLLGRPFRCGVGIAIGFFFFDMIL